MIFARSSCALILKFPRIFHFFSELTITFKYKLLLSLGIFSALVRPNALSQIWPLKVQAQNQIYFSHFFLLYAESRYPIYCGIARRLTTWFLSRIVPNLGDHPFWHLRNVFAPFSSPLPFLRSAARSRNLCNTFVISKNHGISRRSVTASYNSLMSSSLIRERAAVDLASNI